MGNLYEYTETMQYLRDMVLLEPVDAPDDKTPLKEKLAKHPKNKSFVDDKAWGDFGDDNPLPKKKSTKK